MTGVTSLFKKIDEFLFKQIDILKANRVYQGLLSKLSELPQHQQMIVGQVLTFSVVLIPLVVLTITLVGNFQLRKEIEVRENILHLLHQYSSQKTQLLEISNTMASHFPMRNNSDAMQMLRDVSEKKKIDSKKVSLSNFEMSAGTKALSRAEVDVNFKDFSINDLTNLLQGFLQDKRSKVAKLSIQKDTERNVLSGLVHIVHYSKGEYERQ